jgi:hypothetical protein
MITGCSNVEDGRSCSELLTASDLAGDAPDIGVLIDRAGYVLRPSSLLAFPATRLRTWRLAAPGALCSRRIHVEK